MRNDGFTQKSRIYVEDTDYTGIVYHANYLKFMERARTEWLNHLGLSLSNLSAANRYFVITHIAIHYLKSAHLSDTIITTCEPVKIKSASMLLAQTVKNSENEKIVYAQAEITVACIDTAGKLQRLPQKIGESLS